MPQSGLERFWIDEFPERDWGGLGQGESGRGWETRGVSGAGPGQPETAQDGPSTVPGQPGMAPEHT